MRITVKDIPAPGLIVLGIALATANWYFRPAGAAAWTAAIVLLLVFAAIWLGMRLVERRGASVHRRAVVSIDRGLAAAGLIMACSLGAKLVAALGVVDEGDLPQRLVMVILGGFVAFTGNSLPKTVTPLARIQCDAAKAQAAQRFAGWVFALSGLGFAIAWLVLPVAIAEPVSVLGILSGALLIVGRLLRLRWSRRAA